MSGGRSAALASAVVAVALSAAACGSKPRLAHAPDSAGKPGTFRIGEAAVERPGRSTIRVLAFDPGPLASENPDLRPRPGSQLTAAEVEVCNGPGTFSGVNPDRFFLQVDDRDPLTQTLDARRPGLDLGGLRPNGCTRGWITFQVPPESLPITGRPLYVMYSDGTAKGKWTVS